MASTLHLADCGYVCVYADSMPAADAEHSPQNTRRGRRTSTPLFTEQRTPFTASDSSPSASPRYRLILCDTKEQIEQVFTLETEGITFDEAIASVNKRAGRPNACTKATVEATLVEEVRDFTLRGDTYTIIKVAVTAVSDGERMLPVPFLEQFAVMPGKKGQGA